MLKGSQGRPGPIGEMMLGYVGNEPILNLSTMRFWCQTLKKPMRWEWLQDRPWKRLLPSGIRSSYTGTSGLAGIYTKKPVQSISGFKGSQDQSV